MLILKTVKMFRYSILVVVYNGKLDLSEVGINISIICQKLKNCKIITNYQYINNGKPHIFFRYICLNRKF